MPAYFDTKLYITVTFKEWNDGATITITRGIQRPEDNFSKGLQRFNKIHNMNFILTKSKTK